MSNVVDFYDVSNKINNGYTTLQCICQGTYVGYIGWDNSMSEYAFFPYNKITSFNGDILLHIYDKIYYLMKGRILS